jgi:hypothetical protein
MRCLSLLCLGFVSSLPTFSNAALDAATYDEMKYLAHHASDAHAMETCQSPEGMAKLQTWTTGAKGYLALDGQRKWIIVSSNSS